MSDTRLIERWLPIGALGEESIRERRSMTALPPTYYLHVWWTRRPLVATRAAVLASLLPADADREGRVPLAPNWRLAPGGTGVRLEYSDRIDEPEQLVQLKLWQDDAACTSAPRGEV